MKHVADLKSFLEERIAELKEEIEALQEELELHKNALKGVDAILSKESFITAAELVKKPEEPKFKPISEKFPAREEELEKEEFQIRSKAGELIGLISVFGNTISIIPEKDFTFSTTAPPFRSFFQGKILERMEGEDEDAIKAGKMAGADKIAANVITDEFNNIKNIIIQNYGKLDRKMEIINTISWTFRTIYEEQFK